MLRVASDHFSHSDTGRARRANEDSYFARSPLFVVADGMGGAQAGEVASRLAVEAFERGLDDSTGSAEQMLSDRVQEANAVIHEMSQEEEERAGMGTTITAAHVGAHDVAVAHVGDSRAYRLRGDDLERLTQDHSLVEEMRRRGQLTAEEADDHPQRSIITRALGPEPEVQVDTYSWRGIDGDVFLLCSDGLTTMLAEARVADILRDSNTLTDAGHALIDAANEAGGRDNITVILFRLEEVQGDDPSSEHPTMVGSVLTAADVKAAAKSAPARETVPSALRASASSPARRQPAATPSAGPARGSRRRRRFAGLLAVGALVFVPLCFGAYAANQAVYFVGSNDQGLVTVYRGLPYALPAGIELYSVNYVSGVPIGSVPKRRRERLIDHTLRSHDDAKDLVRELELGRVAS